MWYDSGAGLDLPAGCPNLDGGGPETPATPFSGGFLIPTQKQSKASRLAEIRSRCEKATAGPWRNTENSNPQLQRGNPTIESASGTRICTAWDLMKAGIPREKGRLHNSDFLAHAREDVPWLLGLVKTLSDQFEDPESLM